MKPVEQEKQGRFEKVLKRVNQDIVLQIFKFYSLAMMLNDQFACIFKLDSFLQLYASGRHSFLADDLEPVSSTTLYFCYFVQKILPAPAAYLKFMKAGKDISV